MQGFPIQLAKVQRPPLRAATLRRERLTKWLDDHINRRVIFVTAEAGYGKTTLLADWARRARVRVAWYRIDEDDANWVSFVHYLVAAGRELRRDFASTTSLLLDELAGGANNRAIVRSTFIQELSQLGAAGPTAIVIDDYQHVDGVAEIRDFLAELIAQSPDGLSWIIASRRKPGLAVSRLRGMAEVADLGRSDLRFQVAETQELFEDTFEQPLDEDLLETLVRRTEGWAASLLLVDAAIKGRSTSEARSLVANLTGARGDIYDYLAEEVVGELNPEIQSFLMRTSLLRTVTAAGAQVATGLGADEAVAALREVEQRGLLDARPGAGLEGYRYHPLVREFLAARLRQEQGTEAVNALHRRIAAASEGNDWRTAAFHYQEVGATEDLQRVLVESAAEIMARGEFDVAKTFVDRLGPELADPAMNLFLSRVELDQGSSGLAVQRAKESYESLRNTASPLRYLALANLASISMAAGQLEEAYRLCALLAKSEAPSHLRDIGQGMILALDASASGQLDLYERHLTAMEQAQRASDNTHYLGITLLNAGVVANYRGQPLAAARKSSEAVDLLHAGRRRSELTAARLNHAWAVAHTGQWSKAAAELELAIGEADGATRNEALVEAADTWTWYGDSAGASRLLARAENDPHVSLLAKSHLPLTKIELLLRTGHATEAAAIARHVSKRPLSIELCYEARRRAVVARLAVEQNASASSALVENARAFAMQQRAEFFVGWLDVLRAIPLGAQAFDFAIASVSERDATYLTILAELIVRRFDDLESATFDRVAAEARQQPQRWRDALRSVLGSVGRSSGRAATLLEAIGVKDDVSLLRRVARTARGRGTNPRTGLELARRVAPRVSIEDQIRVRIRVDAHELPDLHARRKVLEIVCYLITRPGMAATRDEVVDAVWPDSDPASALNSLNQTLYFLRRVLEPGYVEDVSPNYVHHESDVVWLDGDLVSSRSQRCRQVIRRLAESPTDRDVDALASEYQGKFALDFTYEEWGAAYRDTLHASYLQVMESAISRRIATGRNQEAVRLARRVLEVDATAEQIERLLIHGYYASGAHAAVHEQYGHYVTLLRDELGIEAPSLVDLVAQGFQLTTDT